MPQSHATRRPLSKGEQFVLTHVRDIYGPQNQEGDVFFSDRDEAVIFAKDRAGTRIMAVALTNLARWYEDGTITSLDELRKNWLRADA